MTFYGCKILTWAQFVGNEELKLLSNSEIFLVPAEREREREMSRFQQWALIVKEALDKSFLVAKFFCAVHVTSTYLCSTALVYGPSMLPTFNLSGEIVLLESISTRYGKVGSGDVVIVRSPENPRKVITKRIIGMEGDSITYVVDPINSDRTETLVVPKGHIWVEGDNIYSSNDSRNFGPVPYGLLQGKVFLKIWPAGAFGLIGRRPQTVDPALKVAEELNNS
ncbi:mitochondrial inner membrane protease subunit 1-like isoform X1 [Cynara cardunculus var. scolymus]|uniref:mitochondrial inner membrane protease subunit 1-like isoform X1 n=2 Tax=Cynara cardunculus var. scolymus TaxID=59895 RepID=UPI000D626887|nr:mitochondrial inner membrane protease subunit 1-like isoform X1 [Cynara cardunculus var. scolymus]XP_024961812.1 mitochondrial inner membrane protease subunit 1-like isoform X1 [Cynara cardunculus var. scolymus]